MFIQSIKLVGVRRQQESGGRRQRPQEDFQVMFKVVKRKMKIL